MINPRHRVLYNPEQHLIGEAISLFYEELMLDTEYKHVTISATVGPVAYMIFVDSTGDGKLVSSEWIDAAIETGGLVDLEEEE